MVEIASNDLTAIHMAHRPDRDLTSLLTTLRRRPKSISEICWSWDGNMWQPYYGNHGQPVMAIGCRFQIPDVHMSKAI